MRRLLHTIKLYAPELAAIVLLALTWHLLF